MADDYIRRQDVVMQLSHNKSRGDDEWELAVASDMEIIRTLPSADVAQVETLKAEIYKLKHQSEQGFGNHDYYVGYISALSTVEGILAWMGEGKE